MAKSEKREETNETPMKERVENRRAAAAATISKHDTQYRNDNDETQGPIDEDIDFLLVGRPTRCPLIKPPVPGLT